MSKRPARSSPRGLVLCLLMGLTGIPLGACGESDACPVSNPAVLTDSTGVTFVLSEACDVRPEADAPGLYDCGPYAAGTLLVWGRFISIGVGCVQDGDIHTGREAERPVVCQDEADCPTLLGDDYGCEAGLCQHRDRGEFPRDSIDVRDVTLMCYAPLARESTVDPHGAAAMAVQDLVREACPNGDCTLPLPDDCWQL